MNERKITSNIVYPFGSKYPTEYIMVYHTLNSELKSIIENSGYKKIFLSKYQKSLRFLEGLKTRCCLGNSDLFEKLVDEDNLYSIRLFGEKNIRILFSFISINGNGNAVLLNVFEEKNKSDYESGKRMARMRRNEIIDAHNKKERER